jgi:hypothetical protein
MRWLACFVVVLAAGCLRARATVVHATDLERSHSSGSTTAIAREAPQVRAAPLEREAPQRAGESANLGSVELGAMLPLTTNRDAARVHIAPGVRIFSSQASSVLWGVAVGADFVRSRRGPGFAVEGSLHLGNGGNDPEAIEQALDLFAGVTVHSSRPSTSIAIGPSVGVLGMPGGHSVVMVGLGLRLTSGRSY